MRTWIIYEPGQFGRSVIGTRAAAIKDATARARARRRKVYVREWTEDGVYGSFTAYPSGRIERFAASAEKATA